MSYYQYITDKRKDSNELKQVMEATASDLERFRTDDIKPGILLGLIQSGKTRAFVGVIAKCFDLGYDVAVIFTKNSIALVEQTIKRLHDEFDLPIRNNRLFIWDIIKLQNLDQLTGYVLSNKVVFVVKKEDKNLKRLHEVFTHPGLQNKKLLIIDDEADQASVGFKADETKPERFNFATIAASISDFRVNLRGSNSYLQVTATPYSLYLQPDDAEINQEEFAPLRPAFTHLLKAHNKYIGGDYYFEESLNPTSPASFLHVNISDVELDFLNRRPRTTTQYNQLVINNVLVSPLLTTFRQSICNFLVGGIIGQTLHQTEELWSKPYHCAFVMHTARETAIHRMQKHLLEVFLERLSALDQAALIPFFRNSYDLLYLSLRASGFQPPTFSSVIEKVEFALKNKHIGIVQVNSENEVAELLGNDGQLRLDNPFNIFVGGQSLDRGITIDHLIGFFYGRNPSSFQMDTVLQHSRMYGNRSREDLALTRFYTSARIYEAMRRMHYFDKDLREHIEKDGINATIRFIAKSGTLINPCSPGKLKASYVQSFKAFSRMLPIGFQTRSQTDIKPIIEHIDKIIQESSKGAESFAVPRQIAEQIIIDIYETFTYEPRWGNVGLNWNIVPVLKAIEIGCQRHNTDQVIIYHKQNREAGRFKADRNYGDAPDDGRTDLPEAKRLATQGPVLMLLKQKGRKDPNEWRDAPFYWPVLVNAANVPNYVYTEE
ncbi:MAG: Z1 domain-containing protein [Bacteroidota bacterium]